MPSEDRKGQWSIHKPWVVVFLVTKLICFILILHDNTLGRLGASLPDRCNYEECCVLPRSNDSRRQGKLLTADG